MMLAINQSDYFNECSKHEAENLRSSLNRSVSKKCPEKKFYIFDFQEAAGLEEFRHCGDRDGGFPGRAGRRPGHTCTRQITLPKRHIQKCLLHFGSFSRGKTLLTALDMAASNIV